MRAHVFINIWIISRVAKYNSNVFVALRMLPLPDQKFHPWPVLLSSKFLKMYYSYESHVAGRAQCFMSPEGSITSTAASVRETCSVL